MALVLGRREGESIQIGDDIVITISKINDRQVSVAIDAPLEVSIVRSELLMRDKIRIANTKAS